MSEELQIRDPEDAKVRPRLVWSGIVAAVLGTGCAGLGLMLHDLWLAGGAGAIAVLGLLVAWRGGVIYDTRGQEPPHHEAREFAEGGEHEGISPRAHAVGGDVQATAATRTERKQELLARTGATRAGWRPLAAYGLLTAGAWFLVGQWLLDYPFTVAGQDSALRDVGFAVILVLCGLRLRMQTRSIVASAIGLLAGILLVVSGGLLPHDSPVVRWDEIIVGVAVIVFSALSLGRA